MRPGFVVVPAPSFNNLPGIPHAHEPVLVQALISESADRLLPHGSLSRAGRLTTFLAVCSGRLFGLLSVRASAGQVGHSLLRDDFDPASGPAFFSDHRQFRVRPLRSALPAADGWKRIESAAPASRDGDPSADALHRVRRNDGAVRLRHGGADYGKTR